MTFRWIPLVSVAVTLAFSGCTGGNAPSTPTGDSSDLGSTRTVFVCSSDSGESMTVDRTDESVTMDRSGSVDEFAVNADEDLEVATDISFGATILAAEDKIGQLILGRMLIGNAGTKGGSPAHVIVTTIDDLTAPATLTTDVFNCVERPAAGLGEECGGSSQDARVCLPGLECGRPTDPACLACKGTCTSRGAK